MNSVSQADLTILYGSQTGNAEFLAYNISESAQKAGINAELCSLEDALQEGNLFWQRLLIVTSTHDDGHMPDNAESFWTWLQTCEAGQYAGLPYTVLAIGDSMYDDFCKAGKDFFATFADLGAEAMIEHVECDVDYDLTSTAWIKKMLARAAEVAPWQPEQLTSVDTESAKQFSSAPEEWHRARIAQLRCLTEPESEKRVLHYELELPAGFEYEVGDSLDIAPRNSAELVQEWLRVFPHSPSVRVNGAEVPTETALTELLEIRLPHLGLVNALLTQITSSEAADRIRDLLDSGDRQAIDAWLWGQDVLDVVTELGFGGGQLQPIIDLLRPIQDRSYSISSTPRTGAGKLTLTVSAISYCANGRDHLGTGTAHLEANVGDWVSVRRARAHGFGLPESDAPIIMIGPGVGVAPFRGFLQDIESRGSGNDTWLFFGDQRRSSDWLYREDMQRWLEAGTLTKLNLAFSRDQDQKHYVQHEIRAEAAQLREWVDRGAHIYICGDKNRMAHDVEQSLIEVLSEGSDQQASGATVLEELRAAGRYAKDVY